MTRVRTLTLAGILAALAPSETAAQSEVLSDGPRSLRHGVHSLGIWIGLARNSPDLQQLGHTPGRDLSIVAVRSTWVIAASRHAALAYTVDAFPAVLFSMPVERDRTRSDPCEDSNRRCQPDPAQAHTPDRAVYGAGVSPIGMQLDLRPERFLQLQVGASGGILLFTDRVPISQGNRLNFTGDLGAAVSIVRSSGLGVSLGYRFHHLSNGGLGEANPGVAFHMLVAGLRWRH